VKQLLEGGVVLIDDADDDLARILVESDRK